MVSVNCDRTVSSRGVLPDQFFLRDETLPLKFAANLLAVVLVSCRRKSNISSNLLSRVSETLVIRGGFDQDRTETTVLYRKRRIRRLLVSVPSQFW